MASCRVAHGLFAVCLLASVFGQADARRKEVVRMKDLISSDKTFEQSNNVAADAAADTNNAVSLISSRMTVSENSCAAEEESGGCATASQVLDSTTSKTLSRMKR